MSNLAVYVDADSCPLLVRNHVIKMCKQLSVNAILVANKIIPCNTDFPYKMIVTSNTKDSADNYIYENVNKNDLVITRDIVFANRLVDKNITCINDRGTIFSKENIKELLSERDFNLQLFNIGVAKHFNQGYNKKQFASFANCFDKVIHNLIKNV